MLELEASQDQFQCAVYIQPQRLLMSTFPENAQTKTRLSLATGMGFPYCVHMVIKLNTYSFGWWFYHLHIYTGEEANTLVELFHSLWPQEIRYL